MFAKLLSLLIILLNIFVFADPAIAKLYSKAASSAQTPLIEVFHKNRPPSLQTLAKVNELLKYYKNTYEIKYHLITDKASERLIKKYGLPESHFPFAIVINGKTAAKIGDKIVLFYEFPTFMHGIGRHEGNWSLYELKKVLDDNSLLLEGHFIPDHDDDHEEHPECMAESDCENFASGACDGSGCGRGRGHGHEHSHVHGHGHAHSKQTCCSERKDGVCCRESGSEVCCKDSRQSACNDSDDACSINEDESDCGGDCSNCGGCD